MALLSLPPSHPLTLPLPHYSSLRAQQHSKMISMFKRCDPDGSGHVSIEEFLNAMSRAGIPVGHGLDRQQDNTITEQEAANIVSFFDKDGNPKPQHTHHLILTAPTYPHLTHPSSTLLPFFPFQSRDRRRPAPVQRVHEYATEHKDLRTYYKGTHAEGRGR